MCQHLVKCDKYVTLHKTKGIQNDITREAAALDSKKTLLNIPKLSMETKALLDLDFAEACYVSGRDGNRSKRSEQKGLLGSVESSSRVCSTRFDVLKLKL